MERPAIKKLLTGLFEGAGMLSKELRRAIAERAKSIEASLPAALVSYVEKVSLHAYQVTDEDIAALKSAGYSEDQIFEATISAAVGASLSRLELVQKLLQEA